MKKIVLTAAATLVSTMTFADKPVFDSPDNESFLGIRASFDLSVPGDYRIGDSKVKLFDNGPGVSLGFVYNAPLLANLYIEPGLELYYNTAGMDVTVSDDNILDIAGMKHHSLRKFGMRIPVQFGYHFDFIDMFRFHVFTGPLLNVGFSNDYYLTTDEFSGTDIHVSGSMYNEDNSIFQMNRVDCAWRIGVGFNVQDIFIGLSGDIGTVNLVRNNFDGRLKYRENAFHFTLGYNF